MFAALIPQMMRAGIEPAKQAQVASMISDELRHARQCAGVLHALGAEPTGELPALDDVPQHSSVAPLEALLRNVLSICCLSETVAVALINAERLELTANPLGDVLARILEDEVQHARFGWKLLEDLDLDADLRANLDHYLRVAFLHLETHELAHLSPLPPPSDAAAALGACDGANAREIFHLTIEQVIVPRLEEHGFAARQAWLQRAS